MHNTNCCRDNRLFREYRDYHDAEYLPHYVGDCHGSYEYFHHHKKYVGDTHFYNIDYHSYSAGNKYLKAKENIGWQ